MVGLAPPAKCSAKAINRRDKDLNQCGQFLIMLLAPRTRSLTARGTNEAYRCLREREGERLCTYVAAAAAHKNRVCNTPGQPFCCKVWNREGGLATNPSLTDLAEWRTLHRGPRQTIVTEGPATKVCNSGSGGKTTEKNGVSGHCHTHVCVCIYICIFLYIYICTHTFLTTPAEG